MAFRDQQRKHELLFTHPNRKVGGPLRVSVRPNEIVWSYGLRTAKYPTYGGEVVQILSCYFDDMTISGNVGSYRELERIYKWFIEYIQLATQGERGAGSYDTRPVVMKYPERGWTFRIYPRALPGFKIGRDVVAPEWKMTAAVAEPDQQFKLKTLDHAQKKLVESEGDVKLFGKVTGDIGFEEGDPFRDPLAGGSKTARKRNRQEPFRNDYQKISDFYNNLIPSYLANDFDDLAADYSKPAYTAGGRSQSTATQQNQAR